MYALPNKTQHKLIVKVRGGISQKLDNFNSSSASSSNTTSKDNNSSLSSLIGGNKNTSSSLSSSPFKTAPNDYKDIDDAGFNAELSHLPQPIFHSISDKHGKSKSSSHHMRAHKKFISPEHSEMIKFVQQTWKGVERDYKKSVNNYINSIDLNNSSDSHHSAALMKPKHTSVKKKTATTSTPLLLSGSYHHTSVTKDSSSGRQDSFQPFDLEAFWGNRILKRLTEEI